jgi:hypothetical protein
MFTNQTPKFIPSSQYSGTCLLCRESYTAGAPIYWQSKAASSNPLTKAATWHKACYEAQKQAPPSVLYGGGGEGVAQESNPEIENRGQSESTSQGQGTPQNGSEQQVQNEQQQQGSGGQEEPKLRDQISGLWFDAAKMQRHLHREDMVQLVRRSVCPRVGGEAASQAKKARLAEAIVSNVERICSSHEQYQAKEWGTTPDPYAALRAKAIAESMLQADGRLSDLLLQKRQAAQQQPQQGQPQQQQEQQGQQGETVSRELHESALAAERRKAEIARQEAERTASAAREEVKAAEELAEEASRTARVIEVRQEGREPVRVEGQHQRFGDLLALTNANVPTLMVGPAGGGKTEAASQVAKVLDLDFTPLSLGPQTTQSQVFGYYDATGQYVDTPFRRAYEGGGLILLDELDRCNERVSVTLNAAIANGRCSFPDGTVDRSERCVILAAANTTGHGADRQYVSARQQDAALLDRFAVLDWQYDEAFETLLAHAVCEEHASRWLDVVRAVRREVETLGLRYVVSPRATLQGLTLLGAGADRALAVETILFRGWSPEDRSKVEANVEVAR